MSVAHESYEGSFGGEFLPTDVELSESFTASPARDTLADDQPVLRLVDVRSSVADAYDTSVVTPATQEVRLSVVQDIVTEAPITTEQKEATKQKLTFRPAFPEDMDRIVELDLKMFRSAYGEKKPSADEVRNMMTRRLENVQKGGGWMLMCEVDGKVEGFGTAFRTNKPPTEFVSWEDSTANGTLDGKVDPNGKYAYVVNLTLGPKTSKHQGADRMIANLIAGAMKEGVEYGYFESRMPLFKRWLNREGIDLATCNEEELDRLANAYTELKVKDKTGKQVSSDYLIRMYEQMGMQKGNVVRGAFDDQSSLGYGVVFSIPLPKVPKPFRPLAAWGLRTLAKSPKLLSKVL